LTYRATLVDDRPEGGLTAVTAHVGDRLVAEGEIFFAHVEQSLNGPVVDQKNFVFSMRLLGILDVGKAGDRAPEPKATT
jgi:3-hydroxyacyl-[acyl-carrier-protein] dehydratase